MGFSLIEVLVVIGILGILAAATIALIDPIGQNQKSKDARRISDLKQIQTGLELYRSDVGSYPTSQSWLTGGGSLSQGGIDYIKTVPKDPKPGLRYYYNSPGNNYNLYACAENKNSKEVTDGSYGSCNTGQYILVTSP